MTKQLELFVDYFENSNELLEGEELAKTYVQLTSCEKKVTKLKDINLEITVDNVNKVKNTLDELYDRVKKQKQERKLPFADEKEAYLKEKQERLLKLDNELRNETDKIEEYYTKKTRESIYRNLVGLQ